MKFKLFNRRLGVEVIEPRRDSGAKMVISPQVNYASLVTRGY